MAKHLNSISVFFPAYNDQDTIGPLVEDAFKILPLIAIKYEVIVINDGSTDKTEEVLNHLAQKHKDFRFISHKKNKGYGGALQSGFKMARYDYVFYTDGDGQYDVKELLLLVERMSNKIDLVNGYKIKRHDPLIRIFLGFLYSLWVRLLLGVRLADVDCDFRLFNKRIFNKINLFSNSGAICAEMLLKIQKEKGVIIDIPVHHYPRRFGHSQFFRLDRLFKTFIDDLWLWWKIK